MEEQAKIRFLIRTAYYLTIAVGVAFICRFVFAYFMPFLVGILVAWAVQKPSDFLYHRIRIKQKFGAPVLAVLLFLSVAALLFFGAYRGSVALRGLVSDVSEKLPDFGDLLLRLKESAKGMFGRLPKELSSAVESFSSGAAKRLADGLSGALSSAATRMVKRTPIFLLSTVVALAASCYIAIDFRKLARFLKGVIGRKPYANLQQIKEILSQSVFKLMKGYLILSSITLVLLWIGFFILRIRHGFITALLIALVDFLPMLGSGLVLIPWGIASFFISDTRTAIGLLIVYGVIAAVRYFAEPKVIGGQIGINPLFMLAAMFAGLKIFGGPGLFLAPVALIVTVEYYKRQLENERTA